MRIPMKLRRHYKLLVAVVAVFVISITVFGEARVIPYTVNADMYEQDVESEDDSFGLLGRSDTSGSSDIFDEIDTMHEIEIDMDPDDYESMILTYEETAEKEYFEADITIDGVLYESVGIRLKGNSSLRGALSMSMGPEGQGKSLQGAASENYDTPFMIKFDEFVDQDFMGYDQISLRAQFNDETAMHEVISYEILAEMGFIAPRIVYSTIDLNGTGEQLYMICEVINGDFIEDYLSDETGDLFKASGNAHFIYYDDDPTNYETYELQTNENESDLYDLIAFFQFLDEATDEEFLENMNDYIDMDVMIEYLAFCNVLINLDSYAGNGNNYYLYQDPETEQFLLIPWDLNESFGRFGMQGSSELSLYFEEYKARSGGMMGPGGGGMPPPPDGMMPPPDGVMPPPPDEMMPVDEPFEIANLFLDTAYAAVHDNHPRAELTQQQTNDQPRPPRNGQNKNFSAPVIFEEDMDLSAISPLMDRVFSIEELNDQYIAAVMDLLENEFAIKKVTTRIDEIAEFLLSENEERGFWEEEEYMKFLVGVENAKEFVETRHDYLWPLIREELS